MSIFYREMRANAKVLILWCIGVTAFISAAMYKFTGFQGMGNLVNDMIASMPLMLRAMMGVGTDLSSAIGFYAVTHTFILLMAAIHAGILGASIFTKEERDRTFEFLYVRPVTRGNILLQKILAAVVSCAILNLITLLVSVVTLNAMVGNSYFNEIAILMFGMFFVQLLLLCFGLAVSVTLKSSKRAANIVSTSVMVFYIISIMSDMGQSVSFLRYLTPFKYFDTHVILASGLNIWNVVGSIALCGVLVVLGFINHQRRDLKV